MLLLSFQETDHAISNSFQEIYQSGNISCTKTSLEAWKIFLIFQLRSREIFRSVPVIKYLHTSSQNIYFLSKRVYFLTKYHPAMIQWGDLQN